MENKRNHVSKFFWIVGGIKLVGGLIFSILGFGVSIMIICKYWPNIIRMLF